MEVLLKKNKANGNVSKVKILIGDTAYRIMHTSPGRLHIEKRVNDSRKVMEVEPCCSNEIFIK